MRWSRCLKLRRDEHGSPRFRVDPSVLPPRRPKASGRAERGKVSRLLRDLDVNNPTPNFFQLNDDIHRDQMDSSTQGALQGCVTSLRSSMQLLESSIGILDSGVNDYPRLGKVLQTTRVCPNMRPLGSMACTN